MTRLRPLLVPLALVAYVLYHWPRAVAVARAARRRLRAGVPHYVDPPRRPCSILAAASWAAAGARRRSPAAP